MTAIESSDAASADGPAKTPDRELVLTRIFDAPRRLVFEAWTRPELLRQWWGPRDFSLPVCEMDLRPGGAYFWIMRGPDSQDYPMRGRFLEIVSPERIVFSATLDGEDPDHEILTTVTFTEQDGQTRLTLHQTYYKVSGAKTDGADQGWNQSLDRLAALFVESVK